MVDTRIDVAGLQPLESKLPGTGTTIFTVMSQLAAESGALNLSQGFPEFDPDPRLVELVHKHMRDGSNQYAPMMGVEVLREALAEKVSTLYGREADPQTEVTVCSGATEGLFSSIHALVRPGDEVIVFDPAYDSYEPAVTLAGGITRHVPLVSSDERPALHIDWQALTDTLNDQTRLIILNFPHNPTGAILAPDDLDRLSEILGDRPVYLLSDEVYEHIVFDGERHYSLMEHDDLWRRSLVISSFGKTYHVTGWKLGYCVAPGNLTREFRNVHQWNTFTSVTPMQLALADFMRETPEHYAELSRFYERKRDLFCDLLSKSRFQLDRAAGTFFQTLRYDAITDTLDVDYARQLTVEQGVAAIPVSVFCAEPPTPGTLRFCFAKNDNTLREAAETLCRL